LEKGIISCESDSYLIGSFFIGERASVFEMKFARHKTGSKFFPVALIKLIVFEEKEEVKSGSNYWRKNFLI